MKEKHFLKFVSNHSVPEHLELYTTSAFCVEIRCTQCALKTECNEAIRNGNDFVAEITPSELKYYKEKYIEFFI